MPVIIVIVFISTSREYILMAWLVGAICGILVVRCRWHHPSPLWLIRSIHCNSPSFVSKLGRLFIRSFVVKSVFQIVYLLLLVCHDMLVHLAKIICALVTLRQVLVITLQVVVLVIHLVQLS